jgi:gas vesicle protein
MEGLMKMRDNGNIDKIAAFASGGLLGAGIALLLAPHSGSETRRSLTHLGQTARKGSRRLRSDLDKKMDSLFTDIRDDLKSYGNNGKHWTHEKNRELERAFQTGKRYIEKELEKFLHA